MGSSQLHVALLSSPGMGHLFPVLALGNHLATHHNVKVTVLVLTTTSSPAETQVLAAAMEKRKNLDIILIPPVDLSGLIDAATKPFTVLRIMVREALPAIRSAIAHMKRRPDVLIVDLFCTRALPIADEFKIPKYVHHPTNAWSAALMTYTQVLDKEINGEYVERNEPLQIPGCRPVRPEDVVDPMEDRSDQGYREWMNQGIEYGEYSDGILINTWEDAESVTLKALRENERLRAVVKVPIYPIGPLRRQVDDDEVTGNTQDEVLQWLDKQPLQSVLYVSFGSGGTLSARQITELACGLELSHQRFVWVVQPPSEAASDASFFTTGQGGDGILDYLPEGFITRVQNLGFIVPLWTKQVEILSHPSTGGFLTHCGWNSVLESVTSGVPMIAWPLYAEQRMNATMLAEELGVAVRPGVLPTKKVVGREEIEEMVKRLMQSEEGKAMRERVKKLKKSAENCLRHGGSSYNSMCEFLNDVKIKTSQL